MKLFQALSSNNFVSKNILDLFQMYTNSAQFYENEVDYQLLDRIVKKYNIQLYSSKPINAGMISVVFKGRLDETDVVIKMKRNDVYNRLQCGYKEFGYLYKAAFYILRLFGKHSLLNTIASFVESEDYILTQCDFKDEMFAMRTMRKDLAEYSEMGTITYIDRIIVPQIFNEPEDTDYIIMEFLNGNSSFDVKEEDKLEYLQIACVFTSFPLVSTIQHTDLHPGNIIFMKENGVLKLGIIDFGMFVVNTPTIQNALLSLIDLGVKQRDHSYNFVKHFSVIYEPVLEWEQLAETQYDQLNGLAKQMTDDMINGNLTETHIRNMFVKVKQVLPGVEIRINIDMVKILLGNTMACATAFSLTDDIQLIGELQQRVFKEIIS